MRTHKTPGNISKSKAYIIIFLFISIFISVQCFAKKTSNSQAIANIVAQQNIPQITTLMDEGELSAYQLTEFFLAQINTRNPELNAVISINPNALQLATKLDKERRSGKIRGPLHGIPILIKDNIETIQLPTTAGSLALEHNHTHRDAPLVKQLKEAGAIILGKTNLSEWANMRSERSSSGWSAIGGQTRNPIDLNRSPCGSSSGSAAAVAANLAVAAIGTETDGSIVCPASANGVVGLKPSVGLVSQTGIVPISHSQDTAGPMTKNVVDAAIILAVINKANNTTTAEQNTKFKFNQNHLESITTATLKGKRIGVLQSSMLEHEGVARVYLQAIQTLKNQGAELVESLELEPYQGFYQDSYDVLLYEFKNDLNHYLKSLPNEYNQLTLEKLIQFNQKHQNKEMKYFQQEIFEKAQAKGHLTEQAYIVALNKIQKATRDNGIDKLISEHRLDALISPTLPPTWTIDLINGDHFTDSFSSYSAIAGYPHITLPMGKVHHLPVGISVTGLALTEKQLIEIAFAMEQAFKDKQ